MHVDCKGFLFLTHVFIYLSGNNLFFVLDLGAVKLDRGAINWGYL